MSNSKELASNGDITPHISRAEEKSEIVGRSPEPSRLPNSVEQRVSAVMAQRAEAPEVCTHSVNGDPLLIDKRPVVCCGTVV